MPNLIRLKHYHTAIQWVDHPLLDGAPTYSEDALQILLQDILNRRIDRQALTVALRSSLGNMVGRYKANWPQTIPFLDDMVSEGFLALSRFSSEISLDLLAGRGILKVASQRMQDQIETYLNSNQSLAAAGMTKQKHNIGKGKDPLYRSSAGMDEIPEAVHPEDSGDEWKRDMLDTLGKIDPEDEIDKVLLNHFYWGWTYQELSDMLGVSVSTIHRHKVSLYERFLELTR